MEFAEIVTEPVTGMEAGDLWQQLREHTHDPVTRACPRCDRPECPKYLQARNELARHRLIEGDPAMTLALIKTPESMLVHFRSQLAEHADDAITGACLLCSRTKCAQWREARTELAMAGELDWDPLRDRAEERRRLCPATLNDR